MIDVTNYEVERVPGRQLDSLAHPAGADLEPPDLAQIASSVRALQHKMQNHALEIGRQLLLAKRFLDHGKFLAWVDAEFTFSSRSAQTFMNVASRFGDKSENFAHLGESVVGLLAAPSTPDLIVEQIVSMAGRGDKVSVKTVRGMIRATRRDSGDRSRADRGKGAEERGSTADIDNPSARTPSFVEQMSQQLHGLLTAKLGHEPQLLKRAALLLRQCDPVHVATLIEDDLTERP